MRAYTRGVAKPDAPGARPAGHDLAALQRVADAALAFLSEDDLLQELLARIREVLHADTAAILLLDPDGEHLSARAANGLEQEVEQGVRIPVGQGFAGRIAAERRPITIDDLDHANVLSPLLREHGVRSLLGVPLLVERRVLGVLHVGSLTPRRFTSDERDLLQLAADRAALAIEHANLYEQERVAHATAEAARRRLEALQRVSDAGLAFLSEEDLLQELLTRIKDVLHADTAAILLLDPDGLHLHPRAAKGIEEGIDPALRLPVGHGFAGRIAAERRPITIDDIDRAVVLNPVLRERGVRSLLGVPLLVERRVLGVLHVGSLTRRHFTAEEADVLQLAADRAALAIEHANVYEQRRLAEALQRRLLPEDVNRIPGFELASRYLPASDETFGGDWYDAFELRGGQIAVAVGDVVGHGLEAAAVMAQLRTALRAYASDGHDPRGVVERINQLMWDLGPTAMTTLVYVVIDPETESLEVAAAGHPPPLVVPAGGDGAFLPVRGGVPLGASEVARYEAERFPFPVDAVLVLYTDGLIETRGESLDRGLERLRAAASGGGGDVERLCANLVARLVPDRRADDVAIIAARMPRLADELRMTWPASRRSLAGVRRVLARWLRDRGANADEAYDIVVAGQEACANAIEHADGPGERSFEVHAACVGRRVRVTVRDHGRWRPPRGRHRGRGLAMMEALMDRVDVRREADGTRVALERTLRETAR